MGLFGSRKNSLMGQFNPQQGGHWGTPGIGDEIDPTKVPGSPQSPQPQGDPGFWQGGNKFGVRDGIAGLLAIVGDTLSQRGGGQAGAVQGLSGSRLSAIEMAKKAAEQQKLEQAYAAAGLSPEKARLAAMGGANFGDLAPAPAADPERVRTAQWWQNATPEQRTAFDQTNPIVTQGYGSAMVPRATLPQSGAPQAPAGAPAPGQVEDGYQFMGGDPTNPNSWKPVGGGGGNVTGGFR